MSVVLLEHDRNSTIESQVQEYKVEQVIKHSGYSIVNYNNDIALLKLNSVVMFEGLMRPVCLPEKGAIFRLLFYLFLKYKVYVNIWFC